MATNTYVALDKVTVASAVPSVTLNSISQSYTDLVVVISGAITSNNQTYRIQFNGDTGSNYSYTTVGGTSGGANSVRGTNTAFIPFFVLNGAPNTSISANVISINNYSNATTYKNAIIRANYGDGEVSAVVGLWRSTSAITSITVYTSAGNLAVDSTVSLYGIAAEGVSPAAKATGGTIYSDANYYYHVFASTGAFTPNQALSAQILAVGGGGGGGGNIGAGGGAGAMTTFGTTSSLSSGVAYTCTVGAGGAGATTSANGSTGGTTSFAGSGFTTITALGGGYGSQSSAGGAGGSGGGGMSGGAGGAASGPNTNVGATGSNAYPYYGAGGGGGATAAGTAGTSSGAAIGGNGGQGYAISAIDSALPATGIFGSMTVIASGGGGSGVRPDGIGNSATGGTGGTGAGNGGFQGTNPTASTSYGSGGGGATWENYTSGDGTNGYQGLIIVRYAK